MSYLLYWLGHTDINELSPIADINSTLHQARQGDPDALANLVRINWMVQDLKINPIIKPIFCRDRHLSVIVGDTRIMAAKLAGITHVPVMAYLQEPRGTVCTNIDDIKRLSGFDFTADVVWAPGSVDPLQEPPDWIDIGDHRTRHHGHDQQARFDAIMSLRSIDHRPLDINWILEPRDWGDIFTGRGL